MTGRRFCAKEQLKPRGKSKLCKLQATSKQGVSDGDEAERTMSNPAKYDMWRPGAGTKGVLIHRDYSAVFSHGLVAIHALPASTTQKPAETLGPKLNVPVIIINSPPP